MLGGIFKGESGLMQISVNGETQHCRLGATVVELLQQLGIAGKKLAVERNGEIVPRSAHGSTVLAAGDRLEIVVAVGGG